MNIDNENQLYDPLLRWLKKRFGYYIGGESSYNGKILWHKNIGPSRKCRLDVIGVKNIGSQRYARADELDIIGIEVKLKDRITYQHLAQAAGYKIFVNKAYLATIGEITEEDRHWARILRIGLMRIEIKKRKIDFNIDMEAPFQYPNHSEMLRLLRRLTIGECTFCKIFFFLWDKVADEKFYTYVLLERVKQINKFPFIVGKALQKLINKPNEAKEEEKIYRYVCRPCAILLGLDIKGGIDLDIKEDEEYEEYEEEDNE